MSAPPQPHRTLRSVAPPKQGRSERTLYRILDAAESLIEEKGLADASIPEIVRRAGSSVGGFYARFRDKNELLRALEERFFDDVSGRVDLLARTERAPGTSLHDMVRACVAELVAVANARRNLLSAFLARSLHDEAFRAEALRFRAELSARVVRLLGRWRDAIAHPDPEAAVELAVHFAFGLMLHRVVVGEIRAGGRVLCDADLRREIERNVLGHLGVGVPAPVEERST